MSLRALLDGRCIFGVVLVLVACRAPTTTAPHAANRRPTLHVGTSGDYAPLSIWRDGHVSGFAPALVQGYADAHHLDLGWTRFRWPELLADLGSGKFDVAADGVTVRPERSLAGRFTVPIARGGAVLLLRTSAPENGPSAGDAEKAPSAKLAAIDRPELRVGVNRGGHLERVTRALFHRAEIRTFAVNGEVREGLARGDVDAIMTNTFEAPRWRAGLRDVSTIGPLTHDVTALLFRSDREELAESMDVWLLDEEESGHLDALRARSFSDERTSAGLEPSVDAILAATSERLALMPLVAAAKRDAGLPVEDPAQEEVVLAASIAGAEKAAAVAKKTAPSRERIEDFFRAQIELAKDVQTSTQPSREAGDQGPRHSLTAELRPAIARITRRMALLLVRVRKRDVRTSYERVRAIASRDLAGPGIDPAHIERLAQTIAAIGAE